MKDETRDIILNAIDRRTNAGRRETDQPDWIPLVLVGAAMLMVGLLIGLNLPR